MTKRITILLAALVGLTGCESFHRMQIDVDSTMKWSSVSEGYSDRSEDYFDWNLSRKCDGSVLTRLIYIPAEGWHEYGSSANFDSFANASKAIERKYRARATCPMEAN